MRLPLFLFSLLLLTGLFVTGQTVNNDNSFPVTGSVTPAYLGSSTIASPLHKLYVGGSIKSFNTGSFGYSSPSLYLGNTTASTGRTYFINSSSGGLLRFVDSNANADRLVINSSGNMGIGVAADATYRLKINGFFLASSGGAFFGNSAGNLVLNNWGDYINSQASSFGYIGQVNGTATGSFSGTSSGVLLKAITNVPLSFYTNNTEKLRVAANGNVLVGTTTDAGYKLDVNGKTRSAGSMVIDNSDALYYGLQINGVNTTNPARLYLNTTGAGGTDKYADIAFSTGYIRSKYEAAGDLHTTEFNSGTYNSGIRVYGNGSNAVPGGYNLIHSDRYTDFGGYSQTARLALKGNGSSASTINQQWFDASGTELMRVDDAGYVKIMNSMGVGFAGSTPVHSSALVELSSTSKGFLPPRMTSAQRAAISAPAAGLVTYQTDAIENLYLNKSTGWKRILTEDDGAGGGTNIGNADLTLSGNRTLNLNNFSYSLVNGANTLEHTFSNGNKWLGDGTPVDAGYKLDVNGSIRALTSFSIKDVNGNTSTITQNQRTTAFGNQTGSAGSGYRFYTMLDNSVGSARLYVGGSLQYNISLSTNPQTGVAEIGHTKGGTGYEAVINLNDGKVGIGTSTPSTIFSVADQFKVDANGITAVNTTNTSGVLNLKLMGTSADRPYGIYLNSGGSAGGANGSQYGIYGDFLTSNNGDNKLYGIYFDVKQNLSQYAYGVVAKATTVYNEAIGIDGNAMQANVGGPGTAIGVRGIATSAGTGTLGTTYAGYFDNQAAAGNKNYGVYIKTSGSGTYGIYQEGAAKNYLSGNLSIGTTLTPAGYKLAVGGNIIAEKVRVKLQSSGWPDYVFDKKYKLPSLQETEQFIQQHRHLPGVPSAAEVEKEGIDLGDNQATLLKKIEELTLYIIEQGKQQEKQQQEIEKLKNRLVQLEAKQ